MSIVETLEALADSREKLNAEAQQKIGNELCSFLKTYPEIDKLVWNQFTPYFNDGDTCEFSVNELRAHLANTESDDEDEDEDEYYGDGWFAADDDNEGITVATRKALLELSEAFADAETDLLAAFGDHVEVIVSKDGIDVEEFEHE